MKGMDVIKQVRQSIYRGTGIRETARQLKISRNTVRKIIKNDVTCFEYQRSSQNYPALGQYIDFLNNLLSADSALPSKKRRTMLSLYQELQGIGYNGSYSSVRRYCAKWRDANAISKKKVYFPLEYDKGEAFQFDWSTEEIEIGGSLRKVAVAHFRLCYSRMSFVIAYPHQRMEMLLDAHVQAYNFFHGLCRRGIYDNLKSVVLHIGRGKERTIHPRMFQCSSHYLFDIDNCNPAAGWEKGQVERQVQSIRKRLFVPRQSFSDFESLNEWLQERVIAIAKTTIHPDFSDKTVYQVFQEERPYFVNIEKPFDAFIAKDVPVNSQCLVTFDKNKYSVPEEYANKCIQLRIYAWRICCHVNGKLVAEHRRDFGRDKSHCNMLHYLGVLKRKPGALRNAKPFRHWENMPVGIQRVRDILENKPNGDRELVGILTAIPQYGLEAVEVACELALEQRLVNKSAVLNILARTTEDLPAPDITPPERLRLKIPPKADCAGYERLRGAAYGA